MAPDASTKRKATAASSSTSFFPGKVSKNMTLVQLSQEAKARGLDLGSIKHDKAFLINLLGDGSATVIALKNKAKKAKTSSTTATKSKVSTSTATKAKTSSTSTAAKAKTTTTKVKTSSTAVLKKSTKAPSITKVATKTKALSNFVNAEKSEAGSSKSKSTSSSTTAKKSTASSSSGASKHPRISEKLTLTQLKEEAVARNMDQNTLPKLKSDLLELLVEGSIHLKETPEFKAYHAIVQKMTVEKPFLHKEAKQKKQAKAARKSQQATQEQ